MFVYVRPHQRRTGPVRGHWRRSSGQRASAAGVLLALAAAVVVVFFAGQGHTLERSISDNAPKSTRIHGYVVQVASDREQVSAQATRRKMESAGRPALVIRSDHYAELRPGWFVTVVGPFPPTPTGRAQAEATSRHLTGSIVRLLGS
jgi:hypothetical protein